MPVLQCKISIDQLICSCGWSTRAAVSYLNCYHVYRVCSHLVYHWVFCVCLINGVYIILVYWFHSYVQFKDNSPAVDSAALDNPPSDCYSWQWQRNHIISAVPSYIVHLQWLLFTLHLYHHCLIQIPILQIPHFHKLPLVKDCDMKLMALPYEISGRSFHGAHSRKTWQFSISTCTRS